MSDLPPPPGETVYTWCVERTAEVGPVYEYGTNPSEPQFKAYGVEGWVEAVQYAQTTGRPWQLIQAPQSRIDYHDWDMAGPYRPDNGPPARPELVPDTRPDAPDTRPEPDARAAANLDALRDEVNAGLDMTPTAEERAQMAAFDDLSEALTAKETIELLAKEFEARANEIPVKDWDAVAADVYARAIAEAAMDERPDERPGLELVPDDPAADAEATRTAMVEAGHPATLPPPDADPDPEATSTPLSSLIGETPVVPRDHPDAVPDVPAPERGAGDDPEPPEPTPGAPAPEPGPRPSSSPSVATIGDPGPPPMPPPSASATMPPPARTPTAPTIPNNPATRALASSFPYSIQDSINAGPSASRGGRVRRPGPTPGAAPSPARDRVNRANGRKT